MVILSYCYGSSHYTFAFLLSLIASLGGGFSQALGEMTIIGVTKGINPFCMSGFSSGTGVSGIFTIFAEKVLDFMRKTLGSWVSSITSSSPKKLIILDLHPTRVLYIYYLLCLCENSSKELQFGKQSKISS